MGLAKAQIRDLTGACELLRRSVRLDKKNTNARNLLGLVYFEMGEANQIGITIQGNAKGTMKVSDKSDFENICAEIEVSNREKEMHTYKGALNIPRGKRALFFRFQGIGRVDFHFFEKIFSGAKDLVGFPQKPLNSFPGAGAGGINGDYQLLQTVHYLVFQRLYQRNISVMLHPIAVKNIVKAFLIQQQFLS